MALPFPYAATEIHRDESNKEVPLAVVDGAIPEGLSGHLFVVAPVGNHDDKNREPRKNTLLNGDGMVYRVDFDRGSRSARVTSRLVKPFCFFADEALTRDAKIRKPKWSDLGFMDLGIARMSPRLGARNFGNTALVPMPTKDGTRLLITYDVGRPIEIDPVTLRTRTPVGWNNEWRSAFTEEFSPGPFKLILTTAHPVWDMKTGHLFTVNYTRSSGSFLPRELLRERPWLKTVRTKPIYHKARGKVEGWAEKLDTYLEHKPPRWAEVLLRSLERNPNLLELVQGAVSTLWSYVPRLEKNTGLRVLAKEDSLRLVRWDGHNKVESWDVVLPDGKDGKPVRIRNSMHQLAVTRDYIILADTSFKVALNQLHNKIFQLPVYNRLVRLIESRGALPDMPLYIIRRAALEEAKERAKKDEETGTKAAMTVTATPARLPFSAVHFLADYDNPSEKITLHAGHGSSVDIAEWVREYDISPWSGDTSAKHLSGMVTGAADVGRLGRYVIDVRTGNVQEQSLADADAMWTLALCTAHGVPAWGDLPDRHEKIYWFSNGFWPELLTRFVLDLYDRAPARVMTVEQVLEVGQENPPSPCLFSVDTTTMTIVDRYYLTGGRIISSPQFVPHPSGAKDKGWIVALVVGGAKGEETCELWIFDAHDIQGGPVARLANPEFRFGFTLHAAWLPRIERSEADYDVDPEEDYKEHVDKDPVLKSFFESEKIYEIYREHTQRRSVAPDAPDEPGAAGQGG
ncbi:carotenoid oxygenase family protein [Sorangium sp. So ce429]